MDRDYWQGIIKKLDSEAVLRQVRFFDNLGTKRVYIEYDFTIRTPRADVILRSFTVAEVRDGKRYMLVFNVDRSRADELLPEFNYISGTLLFGVR